MLLLDEAVASVDPQTEVRIQQALSSLVRGRTVIVVAQHGVEAQGTHAELLGTSATYRSLWEANQHTARR